MLQVRPVTKARIYLNHDTGLERGFLCDDIPSFLQEKGIRVSGANVLHPFAGFGSHDSLHKSNERDMAGLHLPVVIFFVEATEKVNSVLAPLLARVTDGLVEAHPTEILKNIVGKEKVVS